MIMKTTGVVRRIDDLGRIVIPKEIRRTLRIRDGEPLEIFVDQEGITLKKYSSIQDLSEIAKNLVETINKSLNKTILITDRDKYIAISRELRKEYLDKTISKDLEEIMKTRETIVEKNITSIKLVESKTEQMSYVIVPIIMNGDAIGLVLVSSSEEGLLEIDEKMANITASFLAKYIEE